MPVIAEQLAEAETQLSVYRATLEQEAGGTLKLRTHAIVCIGLERLVW
ncbi:MAG: hypothetical protein LM550_14675 [Candidatus Contendobacter sp.]|nr:hypothetical protein [Gammaproteobacteria bacterium]MCC8994896.1 hypothetical protein [Candidatus Contendobacter sp.]